MSDDFATCTNCGAKDCGGKSSYEGFQNIANELTVYLGIKDFNGEEKADTDFLVKKAKEILEMQKHLDKEEHKCDECGEWAPVSWEHIEYER